jgi:hypothetical protein
MTPTKVDLAREAAKAAVAAGASTPPDMTALQDQLAAAMQIIADQAAMLHSLQNPPAPEKPAMRGYFSSSPFIRVPIMRGPGYCDSVQFIAGKLETDDPAVIAVLDAAIASQGSGFSRQPVVEAPELQEMRADISHLASVAHAKMVAAGEKTA